MSTNGYLNSSLLGKLSKLKLKIKVHIKPQMLIALMMIAVTQVYAQDGRVFILISD